MSCHTHMPVHMSLAHAQTSAAPGAALERATLLGRPWEGRRVSLVKKTGRSWVPGGAGLSTALGNPQWLPFTRRGRHRQALKSRHDEEVGGQRLVGTSPSADEPVPPRFFAWELPERAGVLKSHRELDSRITGCTVQ